MSNTDNTPGGTAKSRITATVEAVAEATQSLPENHRAAIRWLHAHALELGLSYAALGEAMGRDANTIYQVFTGRHQANKDSFVAAICSYRRNWEERRGTEPLALVETSAIKNIWATVKNAGKYNTFTFVIGESQCGKTTALKNFAARHPDVLAVYVRVPSMGKYGDFTRALAKALGIASDGSRTLAQLRDDIREAVTSRHVLIFDEIHQVFLSRPTGGKSLQHTAPLEFIKEVQDLSRCGVVLCGTPTFKDKMENGFEAYDLKQIKFRRLFELVVQPLTEGNRHAPKDLAAFAGAYGLPPATGRVLSLQTTVLQQEALGSWLKILRMGAGVAARAKQPMSWQHVLSAYEVRNRLAGNAGATAVEPASEEGRAP